MILSDWGWNERLAASVLERLEAGLVPGRVVTEGRQLYQVVSEGGTAWCRVSGAYMGRAGAPTDYPAVGDWVLLEPNVSSDQGIIQHLVPRSGAFTRKSAGQVTEAQVIAANLDTLFIVFGLDGGRNFTERSVERYVTCSWDSGATPVLILNKADLCEDVETARLQAQNAAPGVAIHCTSCINGTGFDELDPYLLPGVTVGLTGRSGVGKSSIVNYLLGVDLLDTGKQRDADLRGRHTTTRREIVRLPSGALLLDTPGLREVQLWGDESSLAGSFPEIEEYAASCRFRDCRHSGEPDCAVQQALADGGIDQQRYESYLELQRELSFLQTKVDDRARQQQRAKNRAFGKHVRTIKKEREKLR